MAVVLGALACGTTPQGTPVELSFGDATVIAAGGTTPDSGGSSNSGGSSATSGSGGSSTTSGSGGSSTTNANTTTVGSGGSAGGEAPVTFGPPTITRFTPSTGPWGTSVSIEGTDLGDATRDARLTVGADLTLTPEDDEVERWSETQVTFRVPFPHEGLVTLETDEGSADAGTFTPSFEVLTAHGISADTDVLVSVSLTNRGIALVLGPSPLTVTSFDGNAWLDQELPSLDLRPETLRLHANSAGELAAFALSNDSPPELIAFEIEAGEWQVVATDVAPTERTLLAGGPDGASVWFLSTDGWERARPIDDVWQIDKGPISDPYASSTLPRAGATSDGALWVARARDTGSTFNDKGAPFMRQLAPDASAFGTEFQMGNDLDDYLTELSVVDRGRGLLVKYCGSDENLLGGEDEVECLTAGVVADTTAFRSIGAETNTLRHAFSVDARQWVTCHATQGTQIGGETWVWPCLDVAALEIDPSGAAIPVFRHDGELLLLERR